MENKFRLIAKDYNGNEVKFGASNCHDAKSTAGRLLHVDSIQYVCVAGVSGNVYFYLNKEDYSSKVNIPSELAELVENVVKAGFRSIVSI